MPICFRAKFGTKITTIIDCFEQYTERPNNLTARSLTWSYYKNNNSGEFEVLQFSGEFEVLQFLRNLNKKSKCCKNSAKTSSINISLLS